MVWWMFAPQVNPFLAGAQYNAAARTGAAPTQPALDTLTRHGTQACCVWSAADGFHHFSDNWLHITGQLPKECQGSGWREFWHPYVATVFDQAIQDLASADPADFVDAISIEGDVMRGEGIWGCLNMVLVPMKQGREMKISLLVADMSETKHLLNEMEQVRQRSELATQSRDVFLSNMSHELRTPLNAILGFAQMLEMQERVPEAKSDEYLQYIRESGETLLRKINDLIEIANIDSGCCRLREETLNLSDLVHSAVEMQSHRAFTKDVILQQESLHPHIVIHGDRARLIHCLSHLIANAITHSNAGDCVTIRTSASSRDGVNIAIQDTGRGISVSQLNNIRRSLHGKQAYFSTDIDNVGIGLSTTKELIELHGGALSLESINGRGTIANLHLPVKRLASLSARVKPKASQAA